MEAPKIPENKDITYIGYATFRGEDKLFGIKRKDRRQHMYLLGKSGTGKSALLENMIIQNIRNGDGLCLVDPHGETVEKIVASIPEHRLKDVVYFNPADTDFHIGFNVLEIVDPKYKNLVSSGLMGIFTKIWANAWSARMEYILNNAILALLDTPGTTLLGINRMLVDKDYRQSIIANLKDPVIKAFWIHEYEAWQDKFRNEAIAPIQNKVGQFLSTSIIRNVVGQSKSTINIFDIMNGGKIFLVNVSKGRIGEDNSRLLGGMLITKIQLAAMERVRIPESERRDFYLYVDEFQNFVTDSFANILSEARKYRLNLTVAHQYVAQLVTKESTNVRDAIFGNVGTMIIFRVGAEDTKILEKEFMPEFTPEDIVNLPNYRIYLKLMIDGITSRPFSARTLAPLVRDNEVSPEIERTVIETSRRLYCRPKAEVEQEINEWSGTSFVEENAIASGEKFQAICSVCGKETAVPFKPEPGRPIYCKDCITKIKSGELKPVRIEGDSKAAKAEYYKPLADLGIEFPTESKSDARAPRRVKKDSESSAPISNKKQFTPHHESAKDIPKPKNNFALKQVLSKVLSVGNKEPQKTKIADTGVIKKEEIKPISLESLATSSNVMKNVNDRSAGAEKMNALKSLIQEKSEVLDKNSEPTNEVKPEVKPPSVEIKNPEPEIKPTEQPQIDTAQPKTTYVRRQPEKEVPEELLKKILEE